VRVCDADSNSYLSSTGTNILRKQELEKKKKYLQPCLDSSRDVTPYVLSVDGMLASEAKELNKRLTGKIANRWKTTYSKVCGWINARISIARKDLLVSPASSISVLNGPIGTMKLAQVYSEATGKFK
jgi:hypothetical protein